MAFPPLYKNVVAGYEDNVRGEDARVLAERIVARDGGELKVVHVEKGSPADTLGALAERGDADLIVLGSTNRAHIGSVSPGSIAQHLLQGARCPLLIAPQGEWAEGYTGRPLPARDRTEGLCAGGSLGRPSPRARGRLRRDGGVAGRPRGGRQAVPEVRRVDEGDRGGDAGAADGGRRRGAGRRGGRPGLPDSPA